MTAAALPLFPDTPAREQLVLRPRRAFREVDLAPPLSIRRLADPRAHAARRRERPTRWLWEGIAVPAGPARPKASHQRRQRAGQRAASMGTGKLSRAERAALALDEWELAAGGVAFGPPPTFGDCPQGPCPNAGCRHHLGLTVFPPKHPKSLPTVKVTFPGRDLDEIPETCSLRAAERGRASLDLVGARMNLTQERVRQVEASGIAKLCDALDLEEWEVRQALIVAGSV